MPVYIYIYNVLSPIYTCKWYVRNYGKIMCQGGDHSKKVVRGIETFDLQTLNLKDSTEGHIEHVIAAAKILGMSISIISTGTQFFLGNILLKVKMSVG